MYRLHRCRHGYRRVARQLQMALGCGLVGWPPIPVTTAPTNTVGLSGSPPAPGSAGAASGKKAEVNLKPEVKEKICKGE